jgi:hypothetical protein
MDRERQPAREEPIRRRRSPFALSRSSLSGLGARRARGVGRRVGCGRRGCSLLFAGWLYRSQSRPSIPSIRHRAAKAGNRQTPTLLHTSLLYLCVCIFCAGRGARDERHVPCSMFQKPVMSSLLLLEIKETDAKERSSLRPPSKSRRSPVPISAPNATLPKRIQGRFAPKRLYPFAVIGRLLKPGGYSPLSSTSLRGGCEVRCSISSPSADRISRVWCLVLGSLQSAVSQSPRKPMISPHCPPRPAKEGSSRWGAMPLTDTDSAGA